MKGEDEDAGGRHPDAAGAFVRSRSTIFGSSSRMHFSAALRRPAVHGQKHTSTRLLRTSTRWDARGVDARGVDARGVDVRSVDTRGKHGGARSPQCIHDQGHETRRCGPTSRRTQLVAPRSGQATGLLHPWGRRSSGHHWVQPKQCSKPVRACAAPSGQDSGLLARVLSLCCTPRLPLVGVSIVMEGERQQNGSTLVNGCSGPAHWSYSQISFLFR